MRAGAGLWTAGEEGRSCALEEGGWSGVEWSGVEWSGVEWSGVEWSGRSSGRVEWRNGGRGGGWRRLCAVVDLNGATVRNAILAILCPRGTSSNRDSSSRSITTVGF